MSFDRIKTGKNWFNGSKLLSQDTRASRDVLIGIEDDYVLLASARHSTRWRSFKPKA